LQVWNEVLSNWLSSWPPGRPRRFPAIFRSPSSGAGAWSRFGLSCPGPRFAWPRPTTSRRLPRR